MGKWKQLIHKSLVILGVFLIRCATFATNLGFESDIAYPEKSPRITVTIVVGKNQKSKIPYFRSIVLQSLKIDEDEFKAEYRDNFSVVFDNRPDFHNGLTTVIPSNRVYVHTEVPELESSIGISRQLLLE